MVRIPLNGHVNLPPHIDSTRNRLILEMLDGRGDDAKAQRARAELPDNVDTDRDQRLPAKFGP